MIRPRRLLHFFNVMGIFILGGRKAMQLICRPLCGDCPGRNCNPPHPCDQHRLERQTQPKGERREVCARHVALQSHMDICREHRYEQGDQPPPGRTSQVRYQQAKPAENFRNPADHVHNHRPRQPRRHHTYINARRAKMVHPGCDKKQREQPAKKDAQLHYRQNTAPPRQSRCFRLPLDSRL